MASWPTVRMLGDELRRADKYDKYRGLEGNEIVPVYSPPGHGAAREGYMPYADLVGLSSDGVGHVDGLTALRARMPTNEQTVYLNYHTTPGDLGGGQFHGVISGGPYVDNDGTIIVPTGGDGSSAWLRVWDHVKADVRWFGAKCDPNNLAVDDYLPVKKCFDLFTNGRTTGGGPGGGTIYSGIIDVGPGFNFSQPLIYGGSLGATFKLVGMLSQGRGGFEKSLLRYTGPETHAAIIFYGANEWAIEDINTWPGLALASFLITADNTYNNEGTHTTTAAITAGNNVVVTPSLLPPPYNNAAGRVRYLQPGVFLGVDFGFNHNGTGTPDNFEIVYITAVDPVAGTFTADFKKNHASGSLLGGGTPCSSGWVNRCRMVAAGSPIWTALSGPAVNLGPGFLGPNRWRFPVTDITGIKVGHPIRVGSLLYAEILHPDVVNVGSNYFEAYSNSFSHVTGALVMYPTSGMSFGNRLLGTVQVDNVTFNDVFWTGSVIRAHPVNGSQTASSYAGFRQLWGGNVKAFMFNNMFPQYLRIGFACEQASGQYHFNGGTSAAIYEVIWWNIAATLDVSGWEDESSAMWLTGLGGSSPSQATFMGCTFQGGSPQGLMVEATTDEMVQFSGQFTAIGCYLNNGRDYGVSLPIIVDPGGTDNALSVNPGGITLINNTIVSATIANFTQLIRRSPGDATDVITPGRHNVTMLNNIGSTPGHNERLPNILPPTDLTNSVGPLHVLDIKADGNPSGNDVWTGTDNEPAIKNALYKHVYENKGSIVELPIGHVRLGRGIHIGYGHAGFQSGRLRGSGTGIGIMPVTNVVWSFTDEPAVSIQGGRMNRIEDMTFQGLNADYWSAHGFGTYSYDGSVGDDTLLATWMRPTWPAQASSRYAPACAIAIDPRVGPADATYHYRDIAYPAAMGTVPQYGKALSSNVIIENCSFWGCGMVGVVVHPNKDSDGNGDFIRIKSCLFYGVPVGLSIGQTQARLNSLDGVDFGACHTAITTKLHGKQLGVFTEAWNCHFSGIQIFDFSDTSISGHITLNFYSEETWRIGSVVSSSAASLKMILTNCKLSFECQTDRTAGPNSRGVPTTMIGGKGRFPIEINAGAMVNYFGCFMIDHSCSEITISGTMMIPRVESSATIQEKCFLNATMGGLVFDRLAFSEELGEIRPQFAYWNLDTGGDYQRLMPGRRWRSSRWLGTPLWLERHSSTSQGDLDEGVFISNNRMWTYGIPDFWLVSGSLTITNLVLTGTSPPSWNDANHHLYGPEPGDFMLHNASQTVFICMTRVGHACTFKQANNYKGLVARDPIDLTTGSFWGANTRYYSPFYPIYGIITTGTNTITNAGYIPEGGGTQVSTQLPTDIKVNDYIAIDAALRPYFFDAYSTKITAINGTTGVITLSANAVGSTGGKRVRIGTFIRTPVA